MKNNTFILMLVLLFANSCATLKNTPMAERSIQTIYELPGINRRQIFDKTKEWIAMNYKSAKDVIQLEDLEQGKIIGRGHTSVPYLLINVPCDYTFAIEFKDEKIRITCDNFIGYYGEYQNQRQPMAQEKQVTAEFFSEFDLKSRSELLLSPVYMITA